MAPLLEKMLLPPTKVLKTKGVITVINVNISPPPPLKNIVLPPQPPEVIWPSFSNLANYMQAMNAWKSKCPPKGERDL